MDESPRIWEAVLEVATDLTRNGETPFSLESLILRIQQRHPGLGRGSISPIVQGMTDNASGGPQSAVGEVLHRVDRGLYRLIDKYPAQHLEVAPVPPLPASGSWEVAIAYLGDLLEARRDVGALAQMISDRDRVLARYGPMFTPENLSELTAEQFKGFLLYENNRHWYGIHRQGNLITTDMQRLLGGLLILSDETRPVSARLNELIPFNQPNVVPYLGKAVLTPILLVVHPEEYGVWNSIAESAMQRLGLWPSFERGEPIGDRYQRVNTILLEVAGEVGVDLWTLDSLWFAVEQATTPSEDESNDAPLSHGTPVAEAISAQRFGLERHLHDFLRDNWEHTELAADWAILVDGGELVGYEYPTAIGRIDLLARHTSEPRWLVIELKRNQSDDQTVGQISRYMGWVKLHLAENGERVDGMVISATANKKIEYALEMVPNVELRTYEVEFRLSNPIRRASVVSPPG